MAKMHLPINSYVRLNQLRRLKELLDSADGLTESQRKLAEQVFGSASLNTLRYQVLREMIAAGYLDEEIKLAFSLPDSPYSVLIEGLKPDNINETVQKAIRKLRIERAEHGEKLAARQEYIQEQRRLRDAAWAALSEADSSHHKSLLEYVGERSRVIAEAEGVRLVRAGRASTKRSEKGQANEDAPSPADNGEIDPNWEEEFTPDESDD